MACRMVGTKLLLESVMEYSGIETWGGPGILDSTIL